MKTVLDADFKSYGRVLNLDVSEFMSKVAAMPAVDKEEVQYEAAVPEFEAMELFKEFQNQVYGGMPVEFGWCHGFNSHLNGLEYHRDSEINIAGTDMILMVGQRQDIDYQDNSYNTSQVEAFLVPKGTAVEIYATTLHYAPCGVNDQEFRSGVILPRGTNEPLQVVPVAQGEAAMLFARNKWLLVHPESGETGRVGRLIGKNLTLADFGRE